MITESSGIYIWVFPDGKGYIGQSIHVAQRLSEEIVASFFSKSRTYNKLLSQEIRKNGLKEVLISIQEGPTFGIPEKLFSSFKEAMIGKLTDLDIAEILYILKSYDLNLKYESLNEQMGGQNSIIEIKQSNGIVIPSLLSRQSTPEEAYHRFAVADIRQENINKFLDKFYNAIFSNNWDDFWTFIQQQKKSINFLNPTMAKQSWPDFVNEHIIKRISIWATQGEEMKNVQSILTEWVIDKMTTICAFLPDYLNQDKTSLNADARRDFDWASKNIYKELKDFDTDVSKEIRENLHKIIGSILTAGKYEYTGQTGRGGLARYLQKAIFSQIKNNINSIEKTLKDTLISQIKIKIERSLLKSIRLSNNKLKADSTWWLLFKKWNPSFYWDSQSDFMKQQTQAIFIRKVNQILKRRNILNKIEPAQYTSINLNEGFTFSSHSKHYRADNNAIRMNYLPNEDQLYWEVREQYKDTKFYHSWFDFYRPLITLWRKEKDLPDFKELEVQHFSGEDEMGERTWISDEQEHNGYILLYRCSHLLMPSIEIIDY